MLIKNRVRFREFYFPNSAVHFTGTREKDAMSFLGFRFGPVASN